MSPRVGFSCTIATLIGTDFVLGMGKIGTSVEVLLDIDRVLTSGASEALQGFSFLTTTGLEPVHRTSAAHLMRDNPERDSSGEQL